MDVAFSDVESQELEVEPVGAGALEVEGVQAVVQLARYVVRLFVFDYVMTALNIYIYMRSFYKLALLVVMSIP